MMTVTSSPYDPENSGAAARRNNDLLALIYDVAVEVGARFGLRFDPKKRELIHFAPPKSTGADVEHQPSMELADGVVEALQPGDSVRWLGIHWDTKLEFKGHVAFMANKAKVAKSALRVLGNTVSGATAMQLRKAYLVCGLSIIIYAAPVWWRGFKRERELGDSAIWGAKGMVETLASAQNQALLRVLPIWKTTPIFVREREAAVPPIEISLDKAIAAYALRLRKLGPQHPVHLARRGEGLNSLSASQIASQSRAKYGKLTRLPYLWQRVSKVEYVALVIEPPWVQRLVEHPRIDRKCYGVGKEQAAIDHEILVQKIFNEEPQQLVLYSDGSQMDVRGSTDGRGLTEGGGWCLWLKEECIKEASIGLGSYVEVYDAEAIALQAGVEVAIAVAAQNDTHHIWAFVDHQAVVAASLTDS